MTGTGELALMLLLTCISAVALWEAARAVYKYVVPRCFGTKKSRRMQRLPDLARAAAEAEIEKWAEQEDPVATDQVARTLRGVLQEERAATRTQQGAPGASPAAQPVAPRSPLDECETHAGTWNRTPHRCVEGGRPSVFGSERPETPPIPRPRRRTPSPTASPLRDDPGQFERERVAADVLNLLTVKNLKIGLEAEGRALTGIKTDLVRRLAILLGDEPPPEGRPTTRQLRYVLYIWRHQRLAGRTEITWDMVSSKSMVSQWIARWKEA